MEQDYNVWFGKRLKEVMEHKGLTAKGLGELSGVGRMTISRILQGRYATAEEVKKIADALEITVDRLKQKDVDLSSDKRDRMREIRDPENEIREALHNVSVAIGKTETGLAYQVLGSVHYILADFKKAEEAFRSSFQLLRDNENLKLVYDAYNSLMVVLTMNRDYDALNELFLEAEPIYQVNANEYVRFLLMKAGILVEYTKQYEEAFDLFKQALDMLKDSGDEHKIRRTLPNIAVLCFRMKQFEQAKHYLDIWYRDYSQYENNKYIGLHYLKDYVKVLLCLDEKEKAMEIIEKNFGQVLALNDPELMSSFFFLYEILHGDGFGAEQILSLEIKSEKMKLLASMLLVFARQKQGKDNEALQIFRTMLADHLILE